jgi:hypothetical protein
LPEGAGRCRIDLTATLLGPDGEEIWSQRLNGRCDREHGPFILPTDGEYVIVFAGGDGGVIKARTGSYEFAVVSVFE